MSNGHQKNLNHSIINREKYKALISNHPCLTALTDSEVEELTNLTFERNYSVNQTIVKQGELIDCVYLIAKGEVEVAYEIQMPDKKESTPQTILRKGDAIGLSRTGFFSQSGVRTATLTTLSETVLIGWNLSDFNQFLQTHSSFSDSMQQAAKQMLRMNFIKQVAPFTDLSLDQVVSLVKKVEEITVPAGTFLFNEGDVGDKCYLIQSGKIEILLTQVNGTEKTLAILEPPALFGEVALLTDSPRNATVRILEKAELLVIQKDHLHDLVKYHTDTATFLMTLIIERSRPLKLYDVTCHHRQTPEGQNITILKDARRGRYFQLSQEGWFIWQQLDGTQTLQDITIALFKSQRIFAPEAVADTIFNLAEAGFISLPSMSVPTQEEVSHQSQLLRILKKLTFLDINIRNIDSYITSSYKMAVHWIFTRTGQFIMASLLMSGMVFFGLFLDSAINNLKSITHPLILLISLILANLLEVILHEMGHAYATKANDHEVHGARIMISWIGFAAFVDTSDMWLSSRKPRIIVNLAGVYVDMVVAGIASIIAYTVNQPTIAVFFWLFALTLYYGVFKNLNPIYENDGYYVLMDVLNYPKLRITAFSWLAHVRFKNILLTQYIRNHQAVLIYWVTCGIFITIAIVIAALIPYYLRVILPPSLLGIATWNLIWILPVLVITNFIANLIISFRRLAN